MWEQSQPGVGRFEQSMVLVCVDEQGRLGAVDATFAYETMNPFAIQVAVHTEEGDVVRELSRDLVQAGLSGPAGEAGTRLWPTTDIVGRPLLAIRLGVRGGGAVVLQAPAYRMGFFVARTTALVPRGTETAHLGLDDVADRLLTGT